MVEFGISENLMGKSPVLNVFWQKNIENIDCRSNKGSNKTLRKWRTNVTEYAIQIHYAIQSSITK